jgi:hypothetical protein
MFITILKNDSNKQFVPWVFLSKEVLPVPLAQSVQKLLPNIELLQLL